MFRAILAVVVIAIAVPATAQAPRIGGMEVRPAGSDLVMLPALDETGCRTPMLIWRCQNDRTKVIYAFDMEIAAGITPEITVAIDGQSLAQNMEWQLSRTRRNALLTDPAGFTAAARSGREVWFRVVDPQSTAELFDRFDLTGLVMRLEELPCALHE